MKDEIVTSVDAESDEKLMQRVRDGDVEQLGVLFERHYERIHALCFRLSGSAHAADDLAQETFLRALRYRASYRGDSAFTTWLHRLAVNVCRDEIARGQRRGEEPFENEAIGSEPGAEDERHSRLEQALARLAPDRREVIVLSRYHDLPYEEIAKILGITPAAARVRAHRAMNELRESYRALEKRDHELR